MIWGVWVTSGLKDWAIILSLHTEPADFPLLSASEKREILQMQIDLRLDSISEILLQIHARGATLAIPA